MRRGMRVVRIVFAFFVVATVIDLVDRSSVASQQPLIASTATATRSLLAGDLSIELPQELDQVADLFNGLTGSFDELTRALD